MCSGSKLCTEATANKHALHCSLFPSLNSLLSYCCSRLYMLCCHLNCALPPPPLLCITLTWWGPAVSASTPVHYFTLIVPTVETRWLTAALQRSAPSLALMVIICCWEMERRSEKEREGEPVSGSRIVLWGQFRWLALKCKLKRASLCSFKVTRARQCNVKLSLPCLCCVRCGDWQKLLVIV